MTGQVKKGKRKELENRRVHERGSVGKAIQKAKDGGPSIMTGAGGVARQ